MPDVAATPALPDGRSPPATATMHASCVALNGAGVLLRGRPGTGKSDLALRLIDAGFTLVADDQVCLRRAPEGLHASPPPTLAGLIELRGFGIITLPRAETARLVLVVDVDPTVPPRLPEPALCLLCGVALPLLRLDARLASAAARVRFALRATEERSWPA